VEFVQSLGAGVFRAVADAGRLAMLTVAAFRVMFTRRWRWRQLMDQMYFVGVLSQLVVVVTGIFTGAVFAAQIFFQFRKFGMESLTGSVGLVAMCRELGPVLAALMIAGRVGSAMAAELATMKTTEQIDALRALGIDPVDYLVVPRFLALMVSVPVLVALCVAAGAIAGYVVAVPLLRVDEAFYFANILRFCDTSDVKIALIKGFLFSVLIAAVACYKGLNSGSGAESVGRATTDAAVSASIAVLVSNFFFTFMLNQVFRS
jgi:phospholipid/cholesterol/gamma-HCH transport system permease protein